MPSDTFTFSFLTHLILILVLLTVRRFILILNVFLSSSFSPFDSFVQVGFGDMVPKKSFLGYGDSLFGKFQMLVCVTYCALGLALLAMCMSLIQVPRGVLHVPCPLQEGVAIKAERIKKKMTGGKKRIEIDRIQVTVAQGCQGSLGQ